MAFINTYRDRFGVEPICKALRIAPSVYYARKSRPASARARRDSELKVAISHIYATNYRVYGAKKIWIALKRESITDCGRDRVSRLMSSLGIAGITRRGRKPVTTKPDHEARRAPDLVKRQFSADVPRRLWVADITYVPTFAHMAYVAFVTDVFSRRIVGPWRNLDHLELATFEWVEWYNNKRIHHTTGGIPPTEYEQNYQQQRILISS